MELGSAPALGLSSLPPALLAIRNLDAALEDVDAQVRAAEEQMGEAGLEARVLHRTTSHMEERLQRAMSAVTDYLERSIRKCVQDSHDGIAARIEDVTAAHVAHRCEMLSHTQERIGTPDAAAQLEARAARLDELVKLVEGLQRRQEELEGLVTRIASTTARDAAAARAESAAELRGLGGRVRLALDAMEGQITRLQKDHAEDRSIDRCPAQSLRQSIVEELRAELKAELQSELESRDANTAWLSDLRDWVATELRVTNRDGDIMLPAATPERTSSGYPSCADAGAGAGLRKSSSLASEIADGRREHVAHRGSAMEDLANWLEKKKKNEAGVATGTAKPSPDLIKAAALELVNMKRIEETEANDDASRLQPAGRPELAAVEELHVVVPYEGAIPPRTV